MSRVSTIARKVCVHEFMAMRRIPMTMSFEDDIAVINSYLKRNGLGKMENSQDGGTMVVKFENGYGLIAEDLNWNSPDEDVSPLYTARKSEGSEAVRTVSKGEHGQADLVYYEFTSQDSVKEFDSIEDALDYLFKE